MDIFLYEGFVEDAIATVSNPNFYNLAKVQRVMDAAAAQHPDWVIENARPRAESIMDRGKAEHYDEAVEWLKKVRAAYLQSGRRSEWSTYKAMLVQTHGRKRKLMGLFNQGDMN